MPLARTDTLPDESRVRARLNNALLNKRLTPVRLIMRADRNVVFSRRSALLCVVWRCFDIVRRPAVVSPGHGTRASVRKRTAIEGKQTGGGK